MTKGCLPLIIWRLKAKVNGVENISSQGVIDWAFGIVIFDNSNRLQPDDFHGWDAVGCPIPIGSTQILSGLHPMFRIDNVVLGYLDGVTLE